MITCRAPGKLFVAGEYAVLEPGHPAVVVAVDRYAHVTVTDTNGPTTLTTELAGGVNQPCVQVGHGLAPATADGHRALDLVLAAADVVQRLAGELGSSARTFQLTVATDFHDDDGRKLGLGSSAAVTVATIGAMARFYGLSLSSLDRYRLAMLATTLVTTATSGGDLAASVWGGWLIYHAPDRQQVAAWATCPSIVAALAADWPGLSARPLTAPTGARLAVGWTGSPASTGAMVQKAGGCHDDFLSRSDECVLRLACAVRHDDGAGMQREIITAKNLLSTWDSQMSLGIMTPALRSLCATAEEMGIAAKPSGAGGGDCGIALLRAEQHDQIPLLQAEWARRGIRPLELKVPAAEGEQP